MKNKSPQSNRVIFSAISTSSTLQEVENETECIEILLLLGVYMTQSWRCYRNNRYRGCINYQGE